ncbi:4-hydroxy-3-methylbut-2-enyl diphosphate reductase [Rhodococcus erythropolis]|nr:4-hydroxy-3-methylbut-2-enyl diphosphate reductase [Rhodococcus erythropolis]MDV6278306.1 4-hydroxy-3-methylbut-2-enyl diphosphate reductase [Rhodococcus erythropolis]
MTDHRKILLASPRGWCAGVDRAVSAVEEALRQYGAPVYVRHEIVHNKHVLTMLERKGAIFVDVLEKIPEGAITVFSAHGVAPTVRNEAVRRGLATVDATCPLVTKVHREVVRYANADFDIILIGHEGHEEIIGTFGEAPAYITVVAGPANVADIRVRDESKVVWLSQTTLSVDETMETVTELRKKFPQLHSPPSSDICYATQNRQTAVKELALHAELIIVVGSKNSSNSVRMVEVALDAGVHAAYLVDTADEIDQSWLDGVNTVGLTSGASAPDVLVDEVIDLLSDQGFCDVEIVKTAEESIEFSLPVELKKDLRATDSRLIPESSTTFTSEGSAQ